MTIDIISDLHFDLHLKNDNDEEAIKFLDAVFSDVAGDVLIIAGDIGHDNQQNKKLIELIKNRNYKHIICVLGNHDYYLMPGYKEYKNSFERAAEMKEMLNSIDGVYCLDGDVIEIEGVKFGGAMGWYDGTYYNRFQTIYSKDVVSHWKQVMNDSKYIKGIDDFYDMLIQERPKIEAVYKECDVMITHINPSIEYENIAYAKRNESITAFYCFDGDAYLENTTDKYWVFGHIHQCYDYEKYGVKVLSNPLGYPEQAHCFRRERIEI
jgi:metallophosphoesterase superfamily enzyme